jgi:hypothetical protein
MKKSSWFFDVASLVGARPSLQREGWTKNNLSVVTSILAVLAVEAVILFALNVSASQAAAVGAFFCFVSLALLGYVISIGTELAGSSEVSMAREGRIEEHVWYANAMAISLLLGVVAIEVAVRLQGGLWGPMWLMWIHFVFVGCSVLSFVAARFFLTGTYDPGRHQVWVYFFTVSYFCTLFTGTTLLLKQFPIT